jgi:hypothetical protein
VEDLLKAPGPAEGLPVVGGGASLDRRSGSAAHDALRIVW